MMDSPSKEVTLWKLETSSTTAKRKKSRTLCVSQCRKPKTLLAGMLCKGLLTFQEGRLKDKKLTINHSTSQSTLTIARKSSQTKKKTKFPKT